MKLQLMGSSLVGQVGRGWLWKVLFGRRNGGGAAMVARVKSMLFYGVVARGEGRMYQKFISPTIHFHPSSSLDLI